jgi:hypothetical protein
VTEGDGEQKASGSTAAVFISYASQDAVVANSIVEIPSTRQPFERRS